MDEGERSVKDGGSGGGSGQRACCGFVGGLDLEGGRIDGGNDVGVYGLLEELHNVLDDLGRGGAERRGGAVSSNRSTE